MAITFHSKTDARKLALEILAHLEPFFQERGLTGIFERAETTSKTSAQIRFQFSAVSLEGEVQSPEAAAFRERAGKYGFKPNDLGRTFRFNKGEYRIVGWREDAVQYPVMTVKTDSGKTKNFVVHEVLMALRSSEHNTRVDQGNERYKAAAANVVL